MARKVCAAFGLVAVFCIVAGAAHAQLPKFDPSAYAALADADSNDTIPVGTRITLQNWQQYRKFLPVELQWVLEKKVPWPPVPSEWAVEIGPDFKIVPPSRYREDTEKYSSQVRLVKASTGGYALKNYTAGLPFPTIDPNDPQVGIKILYNYYYKYYPWCDSAEVQFDLYDRFGNHTSTTSQATYTRIKHVSETGMPHDRGIGDNYDFTEWIQTHSPEQSKYTTLLSIFYDDPSRVEERYLFVPALRRTLRLSASARCAPFQGTDWLNEDAKFGFNGQPPYFRATYLGKKKLITLRKFDWEQSHKLENYWLPMGWPKPAVAKWQVHEFYVMDAVRLPAYAAGYCLNHRVMYMDPETWTPFWIFDYDNGDKAWKSYVQTYTPTELPDGSGVFEGWIGKLLGFIWDVQVMHTSMSRHGEPKVNERCGKWNEPTLYSLPSGLSRINR